MTRRTLLELSAAAAAASVLPGRRALAADTPWRTFELVTRIEVLAPSGVTRAWIPLPLPVETDWQKRVTSPVVGGNAPGAKVVDGAASLVCAEWAAGEPAPVVEARVRVATRNRAVDLAKTGAAKEDDAVLAAALRPSRLITTDGIVAERATAVTAGATTDVDKARRIYEWIVDNTFRDPKVRGCGLGDIRTMLETGNLSGKCADLNGLFVGMCRAVGVPARDLYGVRVAPSATWTCLGKLGDVTKSQHCRAEFYAAGHGWVPVDPADVRKLVLEEGGGLPIGDPRIVQARATLFGSVEMNWIAYNQAADVALPGAVGEPLPFFMYPQVQTADGWKDCLDPPTVKYTLTSSEIA